MTQYLKVAGILFAICAVAAICLGFINEVTAPQIAAINRAQTEAAYQQIAPGFTFGEEREGEGVVSYNIPLSKDGKIAGYILSLTGGGYGGSFTLVAAYNADGSVLGAKMMGNSETAGLGKKSEESWYMKMFAGLGGDKPLPNSKNDLEDPNLVSGASITFGGVTKALKAGSEYVRNLGGK